MKRIIIFSESGKLVVALESTAWRGLSYYRFPAHMVDPVMYEAVEYSPIAVLPGDRWLAAEAIAGAVSTALQIPVGFGNSA